MVSAVGTRPNHYEVLGLTPSASDDDIAQAFAKLMSMFRAQPIAAIAQLSAAFETLRNPAKRRVYDRKLGLGEDPAPQPQTWAFATRHGGTAFFDLPQEPATAPASVSPTPPAQKSELKARLERPAEPRVASFIAASLRDPVKEEEREAVTPPKRQSDPVPPPQVKAEARVDPRIEDILAAARAAIPDETADVSVDWKRAGIVVGALVVGVGLLGAWAGISAGGDAADSQGVTVALPSAKTSPKVAAAAPRVSETGVRPETQSQLHLASARTERAVPRQQQPVAFESKAFDQVQTAASEPQDGQSLDNAVEQAVASPAAAEQVPASMPLPNRVIARTIEHIGYSCGEVASTDAIEGSAGAFNVTCTSGQSYRAAPVRGRYHFRRLGRN